MDVAITLRHHLLNAIPRRSDDKQSTIRLCSQQVDSEECMEVSRRLSNGRNNLKPYSMYI
jgi:hypothetical protein